MYCVWWCTSKGRTLPCLASVSEGFCQHILFTFIWWTRHLPPHPAGAGAGREYRVGLRDLRCLACMRVSAVVPWPGSHFLAV